MKRILALILAVTATFTLAACSSDDTGSSENKADNTSNSATADNSSTADTSGTESADPDTSKTEPSKSSYDNPVAVLDAAWGAYPEADKFPVFGGSTDVGMNYDNKPGPFTLTMTAEMTSSLKVPESIMPQIKTAASLTHMMNANTFTCAAFEVDGDIDAFSKALVDSVNSTQWMCGFPETVITVKVGNYLIMAFGNGEIMTKFKTAVTTAVDGAAIVHEGPVSFGGGNNGGNNGGNGDGIMVPVF